MHHPTDLTNTHKRKNCFQNFSLGAITTKLRKGKALRKHSLQTDQESSMSMIKLHFPQIIF